MAMRSPSDAVEKGVGDARSRLGDVAERLGVDAQYAGKYRRRLIDAEMIQPAGYGFIDFGLPYMREYLRSHPASDAMEQFSMWPEEES